MLEVTIRRSTYKGQGPDDVKSFQFENDALQAFFDALTTDDTVQLVSLRSMTSPIVLTGGPGSTATPMRHDPKTAGPGAPRTQAPGINTPLQEQAREAGTPPNVGPGPGPIRGMESPGPIRGAVPTKAGKPETK